MLQVINKKVFDFALQYSKSKIAFRALVQRIIHSGNPLAQKSNLESIVREII